MIGPGGRNIKAMQEQYQRRISILDDTGKVQVFGIDQRPGQEVHRCHPVDVRDAEDRNALPRHRASSIRDFGAFVEILPGVEGLCHISELAEGYVSQVNDVVDVGDQIEVVVINVDDRGKIKLSHKAAKSPEGGAAPYDRPADAEGEPAEGRPPREGDAGGSGDRGGDRPRGGDRGGRGGGGGGDRNRRGGRRGREHTGSRD